VPVWNPKSLYVVLLFNFDLIERKTKVDYVTCNQLELQVDKVEVLDSGWNDDTLTNTHNSIYRLSSRKILSLLPKLPKDYKVVLLKNEFGKIEGARIYMSSHGALAEFRYQ
jgi:hypothetical protein